MLPTVARLIVAAAASLAGPMAEQDADDPNCCVGVVAAVGERLLVVRDASARQHWFLVERDVPVMQDGVPCTLAELRPDQTVEVFLMRKGGEMVVLGVQAFAQPAPAARGRASRTRPLKCFA